MGEKSTGNSDSPLTKRKFERQLEKVFTTPVPPSPSRKKKPVPEASETSEHRPSDDCSETRKSPDRTEGT